HCTGLFAWTIADGSVVDDVDVSGRTVVGVSAIAGNRHGGEADTALFVDRGATDEQFAALTQAFGGELDGPLRDLAEVSGTVRLRDRADISIDANPTGWKITVDALGDGGPVQVALATGAPARATVAVY
ncbi:MAG: DUF1326 domain-containing protein, partial [Candidatus Nanopelagicales bacterium]